MPALNSKPTVKDVAKRAGVSTATVGRALGGYGRINETTKQRILQLADEMGYRLNRIARSMITGRTLTIGVVVADINNPFFSGVVRGMSDRAREHGYELLITNSDENIEAEVRATELLLGRQVDGLIISPTDVQSVKHINEAIDLGKPVVLFDRASAACDVDAVVSDGVDAMQNSVRHLIEQGHRRIAIVVELTKPSEADWEQRLLGATSSIDAHSLNVGLNRLFGYVKAHLEFGIDIDPGLVLRTGEYSHTSAASVTRAGLLGKNPPTALVAIDNTMSLGAYFAIRDLGVVIPDELSLILFDNLEWTRAVSPAISVIEQQVYEMGARAADVLIDRIADPDSPKRVHTIPTRLLLRDSVTAV